MWKIPECVVGNLVGGLGVLLVSNEFTGACNGNRGWKTWLGPDGAFNLNKRFRAQD